MVKPVRRENDAAAGSSLSLFLRNNRDVVIRDWERSIEERVSRAPILRSHVPSLLQRIAEICESRGKAGADPPRIRLASPLLPRLDDPFDVDQAFAELAQLRQTALRSWLGNNESATSEILAFNDAIDDAVEEVATQHADALLRVQRSTAEVENLLARATTVLSTSSLDVRSTLDVLAKLTVPDFADWCVVDLVQKDGGIERVSIAHVEPSKLAVVRAWSKRYPPRVEGAVGSAIRSGKATLAADMTPEQLEGSSRDPEHLRLLRTLGLTSYLIMPLIARERILGAISLAMAGRRYGERDLPVALELARRAAVAVDNALLYEEAQRAVTVREEVLAVVSHDLKNPLGVISMAATMMLKKVGDKDPQRELVAMIQRSVVRMDRLIGSLLDMATLQAGHLTVERGAVDVIVLIEEALEAERAGATAKGITLVADAAVPVDTRVLADRDRMLQVLANLIGNALKFCARGDSVTTRARLVDGEVELVVTDSGPGIAEGQLESLFDAYSSTRDHANKGQGLGLYITKGILEAHGSTIAVKNEPQGGATFSFRLPTAEIA